MVSTSVGRLRRDVSQLLHSANACIDLHGKRGKTPDDLDCLMNHIELVIIDEAERLSGSSTCATSLTAATSA